MTITKHEESRHRPKAKTLFDNPDYSLILELDFHEMIPFVLTNIRKKSLLPLLYFVINVATFAFILIYTLLALGQGQLNAGRTIWQLIAGILAGSILVIPPHEMLHGLAYRLLGARNIRFGADLQQFIFYVTADHFPISKRELAFLALTPFMVINTAVILMAACWIPQLTLFLTTLLLSHNMMCIGDFAMLTFACDNRGNIFTFDDIQKRKSYFFEERAQGF